MKHRREKKLYHEKHHGTTGGKQMKFLVLGCNGMAGHIISLYLKEQGYEVDGFAREESPFINTITGDARDIDFLRRTIENGNYRAVVNCIGVLNKFAENNHEEAFF